MHVELATIFGQSLNCGLTHDSPRSVTKLRNRRLRQAKNPDGSFLEISLDYRQSSGKETSARWEDTFCSLSLLKKEGVRNLRLSDEFYEILDIRAKNVILGTNLVVPSSDIYPRAILFILLLVQFYPHWFE